jgi:gliding motility-associated-like protein
MSVSVFIDAFADAMIAEGGETVHIEIENIADCGETLLSSSFEFVIQDIAEPLVVEGMDYEICSGETQTLEPVITGGYAVYHFDWSTGETTETIDVTPDNTTTYFLTVSDTCGMPSDDAQFVVNVLLVPVMTVDLEDTDNILPLECEEFGNVYASVNGGIAPYNYSYTDDQGNNLWGMENTVGISSWSAGMIYVDITDECGFTASDSLFIEVNAPPLFVTLDAPTTVGCNEAFTATANANGGYLSWGYSYQWWLNGSPDWSSWTEILNGIATEANTLVEVSVTDNCGQTVSAQSNITTLSPPITITLPEQNVGNCNTVFTITPDIEGGSGDLGSWTYAWSANGGIIGNNQVLITGFDETTNVSLSAFDMCGVEGSADLTVEIENPEITIDLGEDISTSCISNTILTANYEGGSGGVTFQWLNNGTPAGTLQTLSVQTFETIDIAINVLDACGQSASDVVSIIIPQNPIEMTLAQEQHICPGDSASIWALASGGEGGFGYNWSNGVNQPSFTDYPAVSTNYIVTATDICGKSITGNVLVGVHPVVANFTATKLEDNVYEFINTSTPEEEITEVVWNFGDGDTDYSWNSQHVYDGMQEYTATLHVTNVLGCTDEGSYAIMPAPIIYIPSAFTPNADGLNDVWKIEGRAIREFELKIFNRWGALVYASTDPEDVWVGDQGGTGEYYVQNNVYNYILRVKGYDGETITKKGTITMMR